MGRGSPGTPLSSAGRISVEHVAAAVRKLGTLTLAQKTNLIDEIHIKQLRNSRDVGPRFHGMPVQDFRACRPGISRHVGPAFQSMSVQFVRQDNHGYRGLFPQGGEIDGGPSEVVHAADSRDFTAPGRGV